VYGSTAAMDGDTEKADGRKAGQRRRRERWKKTVDCASRWLDAIHTQSKKSVPDFLFFSKIKMRKILSYASYL
jgi:hypothetical protein